ncbi:MAG: hypothetical protein EBX72_09540, partial [Betaproteobacteria bacterium]|nr:hypothetical protein [Betaproteobacteria bacterium]
IDMVEFTIRQALGEPDPLAACQRHVQQKALSVRFVTSLDVPDTEHPITSIDGLKAAADMPGVAWVRCHLQPGDRIPALAHSGGRFGAVLAFAWRAGLAFCRFAAGLGFCKLSCLPCFARLSGFSWLSRCGTLALSCAAAVLGKRPARLSIRVQGPRAMHSARMAVPV